MTYKTILISLTTGFLMLISTQSFSQNSPTKEEQKQAQEAAKEKAIADELRLLDAKELKKNTKADARIAEANAKEANRIDKEAAYAAKQAKRAARMEAKAQRTRSDADAQAKRAAKAAKKSSNN